jgi:hypothetical protein
VTPGFAVPVPVEAFPLAAGGTVVVGGFFAPGIVADPAGVAADGCDGGTGDAFLGTEAGDFAVSCPDGADCRWIGDGGVVFGSFMLPVLMLSDGGGTVPCLRSDVTSFPM